MDEMLSLPLVELGPPTSLVTCRSLSLHPQSGDNKVSTSKGDQINEIMS